MILKQIKQFENLLKYHKEWIEKLFMLNFEILLIIIILNKLINFF